MKNSKAPEASNNQGNINNRDIVFGEYIPSHDEKPVFRMFQCMTCKQSFKRSEGVLLISGFRCYADLPDTWPGSD